MVAILWLMGLDGEAAVMAVSFKNENQLEGLPPSLL
jgi:hypothetical protein